MAQRVFVTRHYIAVEFFDIETDDPKIAQRVAQKAAKLLYKDVRQIATDNGWIPDNPIRIDHIGYASNDFETKLVMEVKTKKGIIKVYQAKS